jgi:uncharacterized protein (DUF1501 family)
VNPVLNRRGFVLGSAALAAAGLVSRAAFARAATDRRFVFVIQRGAADGLGTVAPVGDPDFVSQRGALAQDFAEAAKLDSMFALHPQMPTLAGLFQEKEALLIHAVASPYRDRSHFDGQNVLETGGSGAYRVKDGWLNRLLPLLPEGEARAMAVAATVPMALRGPTEVASYAPSNLPQVSDDLLARVATLYANDAQLHALWSEAMSTRTLTSDMDGQGGQQNGAATGALAAKLLAADNGARVAMIETTGWDTHAQQPVRLGNQLRGLDAMLGALKTGLGPLWANTMVLVATEFGRTVRVNGTLGTDHGTASCAMLIGGAVNGGRVAADWPGLRDGALYEGRDLRPTTALDAVIASATAEHFRLDGTRVGKTLFPETTGMALIPGVARA